MSGLEHKKLDLKKTSSHCNPAQKAGVTREKRSYFHGTTLVRYIFTNITSRSYYISFVLITGHLVDPVKSKRGNPVQFNTPRRCQNNMHFRASSNPGSLNMQTNLFLCSYHHFHQYLKGHHTTSVC